MDLIGAVKRLGLDLIGAVKRLGLDFVGAVKRLGLDFGGPVRRLGLGLIGQVRRLVLDLVGPIAFTLFSPNEVGLWWWVADLALGLQVQFRSKSVRVKPKVQAVV